VIFHKTRHDAQAHNTSGALLHCAISGHKINIYGSAVYRMISLASVGYGNSRVTEHILWLHLVFQPIWRWGDPGFFHHPQTISSPEEA